MVLTADEGKALAEFQQKLLQVCDQRCFQLPLLKAVGEGEEVEDVGIL